MVAVVVFALSSSKGSCIVVMVNWITENSGLTFSMWKKLIFNIRVKGTRFDVISKIEKESLKISDFRLSNTLFDYFEKHQTINLAIGVVSAAFHATDWS